MLSFALLVEILAKDPLLLNCAIESLTVVVKKALQFVGITVRSVHHVLLMSTLFSASNTT